MIFRRFSKLLCGLCLSILPLAATATDQPGWIKRQWNTASSEFSNISQHGQTEFYAPVYVWHMPFAYDSGQRDRYNNTPQPAFGIGKGRYTENGNHSSYYGMAYIDSNDKWSANIGYSHSWQYGQRDGFNYGLGYTLGLMTRDDYFSRVPFPFILPTLSMGYDGFKVEGAYVPGVKRGTGNVMFIWLKYELK